MNEPRSKDRLTHAYQRMMERAHTRLEQAGQETLPRLRHALDEAAKTAVELGELTWEEARTVAGYVRRDLEDAGAYLAATGHDLGRWLSLDAERVEDGLLRLFMNAADKTRLELLAFSQALEQTARYRAGEITGPGTLVCDNCGQVQSFHDVASIPACPGCGGDAFSRPAADSDV